MPTFLVLVTAAFLPLCNSLPRSAVTVTSGRMVRPQLCASAGALEQPAVPEPELVAAAASGGGATVTSTVINLSKNIVGAGVLALAAGVAGFSSSPVAIVPALALLFFLGAASGYSFSLIARVGDEMGTETYKDTWAKIFGSRLSIIPALTIAFKTYVGGLSYSIILGDSFASIASLVGAPALLRSSNVWICLLSAFVLLPLSLMRDLSSLAIGSVIGTAGTLYTALFIWLRCLDGSYAAGGAYHGAIAAAAQPTFAAATAARPLLNPSIFVLVSMLATTFLAHYNAPKYFNELQKPADGSSKQAAFNKVCAMAFGLAALLCGSIMAGGYLTFGGASQVTTTLSPSRPPPSNITALPLRSPSPLATSGPPQGLILNNYATSDPLAFVARLGISASILFSYAAAVALASAAFARLTSLPVFSPTGTRSTSSDCARASLASLACAGAWVSRPCMSSPRCVPKEPPEGTARRSRAKGAGAEHLPRPPLLESLALSSLGLFPTRRVPLPTLSLSLSPWADRAPVRHERPRPEAQESGPRRRLRRRAARLGARVRLPRAHVHLRHQGEGGRARRQGREPPRRPQA